MGQPAARQGDMTVHGGSIVMGFPMVLIGGQPAARMGDMHTCPMQTPGTPPIPHVGGPISKGSMGVLIGNMPAARMGDMCVCVGPPDTIAKGCPTVLIGEGAVSAMPGQGSGEGKDVDGSANKSSGTEIGAAQSGGGSSSDQDDSHYLNVKIVDNANFPITDSKYKMKDPKGNESSGLTAGGISLQNVEPGAYEISVFGIVSALWEKSRAKVGETVKMNIDTAGIAAGTKARIEIWMHDPNFSNRQLKIIETDVSGDKIQGEWKIEIDERMVEIIEQKEALKRYSSPSYYFTVEADNFNKRSNMLTVVDDVEIYLKDKQGNAIPNRKYQLFLPNGEIKSGNLDGSGYAKETDVPAGRVRVYFDLKDEQWKQ